MAKLLSVMTHEIMNSIAPISSLAETLRNRLKESRGALTIIPEVLMTSRSVLIQLKGEVRDF